MAIDEEKKTIKFVKYTGEYPILCNGMLIICFQGKEYAIEGWKSGGSVYFDDEWNDFVTHGDWQIDIKALPDELKPFHDEIEKLMNEHVQLGCCGGCI